MIIELKNGRFARLVFNIWHAVYSSNVTGNKSLKAVPKLRYHLLLGCGGSRGGSAAQRLMEKIRIRIEGATAGNIRTTLQQLHS